MSNTHGGARKNSGRHRVDDPKIQVSMYVRKSVVNRLGGLDRVKDLLGKIIDRLGQKR